jgi:hypothetical protein
MADAGVHLGENLPGVPRTRKAEIILVPAKDPRIHRPDRATPRHPSQKRSEPKTTSSPKIQRCTRSIFQMIWSHWNKPKRPSLLKSCFCCRSLRSSGKKSGKRRGGKGSLPLRSTQSSSGRSFSAHCRLPQPIPKKSRFSKSSKTWRKHVPMLRTFRRRRGKRKNTGGACCRNPRY